MKISILPRFLAMTCTTCFLACQAPTARIDYQSLPTRTAGGINVVVEIPAGTNHKIEYDKTSDRFLNDQENGRDRIVNFLPYPGNYGYIPGTYLDPQRGGDGDALDILVLSESQATGSLLEVLPIAALQLKDCGEWDTKIIAIPSDSTQQIMAIRDFTHFMTEYNGVQAMVKNWFLQYKGLGEMEFVAWQNERFAEKEIEKWLAP